MSKYGISVKEYVQPRPFSSRGYVTRMLRRKRTQEEIKLTEKTQRCEKNKKEVEKNGNKRKT